MLMKSKLYIIEGCDTVGKTTVAQKFSAMHGTTYIKGVALEGTEDEKAAQYKERIQSIKDALQKNSVILDRDPIISEMIYGTPSVDYMQALNSELKTIFAQHSVIVVVMTCHEDTIRERLLAKKRDFREDKILEDVNAWLTKYELLAMELLENTSSMAITKTVLIDVSNRTPDAITHMLSQFLIDDDKLRLCSIIPKSYDPVGSTSLVLAHTLRDDPVQVTKWKNYPGYKILDNSAFELKSAIPIEELCDLADAILADEIVLPDEFSNADATIIRTKKALDYLVHRYGEDCPYKVMGVPQGNTLEEWNACYDFMIKRGVDVIAINRDSSKFFGSREAFMDQFDPSNSVQYHLLGMADNITELKIVSEKFPWVRSIDSSFPWLLAKARVKDKLSFGFKTGIERKSLKESIDFDEPFNVDYDNSIILLLKELQNQYQINIDLDFDFPEDINEDSNSNGSEV